MARNPEYMLVTPEVAKMLLANNYSGNRNIRRSYVEQLADVMRGGRFRPKNGATIVIGDKDGMLYDGQHRLSAIIESGCSQELLVVYTDEGGLDFETLDGGRSRESSDFIPGKNKTAAAAYAKVMACIEWSNTPLVTCLQGKFNGHVVDRALVLAYFKGHEDEVAEVVQQSTAMQREARCGSTVGYSAFMGIVRYVRNDGLLDEFVEDFRNPVPESVTVQAVKNTILRARAAQKGAILDKKWVIGVMLDAYTHYLAFDDSMSVNKGAVRLKEYQKRIEVERAFRRIQ